MVHDCGGCILPAHWTACKATLAFFTGAATSKLANMTKAFKEEASMRPYLASINVLEKFHFAKAPCDIFSHSLKRRAHDSSICLWILLKGLVHMKSGCGFHKACNNAFIQACCLEMRNHHTQEEVEQMFPLSMWEYNKNLDTLVLLLQKFRRDTHLALIVGEVLNDKTNKSSSRAELKRQKMARRPTKKHANMKQKQQEIRVIGGAEMM
jgi:hypothetical protein